MPIANAREMDTKPGFMSVHKFISLTLPGVNARGFFNLRADLL